MSNSLALATVSAALCDRLSTVIQVVSGAQISTVRPDEISGVEAVPGLNVFLYGVTPNARFRNEDLPTRRADGQLVQRPTAAYDLHFLLTAYGDDRQLQPAQIMGAVLAAVHARPVLDRASIEAALASPTYSGLGASDLAQQPELVRITPEPYQIQELSALWSIFAETAYRLSVGVKAGVVLIEDELPPPRSVLPVAERRVYVEAMRELVVDTVHPEDGGPTEPVVEATVLVIEGRGLRGAWTRVLVGDAVYRPVDDHVTDRRIWFSLATTTIEHGALRAGAQSVRVRHSVLMGSPPTPHRGAESNAMPLVVRPTIAGAVTYSAGSPPTIQLTVSPAVDPQQTVLLLIDEPDVPNPRAHVFAASPRATITGSLTFAAPGLGAGSYLVRVQVDGAQSVLIRDTTTGSPTFGRYVQPSLTVP